MSFMVLSLQSAIGVLLFGPCLGLGLAIAAWLVAKVLR